MTSKRFLIVDEDDVVRSFLRHCLLGLNPTHQVYAEPYLDGALDQITIQDFDVLIVDLNIIYSAGDVLMQTWKSRGVEPPVIVATSFTEHELAEQALPVRALLSKPIQLERFEEMMRELLGNEPHDDPDRFSQNEALYSEVNSRLSQLQGDTTARCILLCDPGGRIIHLVGDTDGLAIDTITSLLSGGIATLLEAGRDLDDQDVINLAYREGKQSDLYAVNVHDDWILIIVIDRGLAFPRLGAVWYYARKAAVDLKQIREMNEKTQLSPFAGPPVDQAVNDELDKLFQG